MTPKELEKALKEKDEDVRLEKDSPTSFRIFVYQQRAKYPITSFIDRSKNYKIIKISDYPKQEGHYPICVVRIERLRLRRKVVKRKESATEAKASPNIKGEKKIVKRK